MTQQNNIFLTYENLAFSLPLVIVCSAYAYFRYIPLEYGLPALAGLGLIISLRSRVRAHKDKKLEVLDEDFVKELAGDEEESEKKKAEEEAVKARKAKAKLEHRLAVEAKKARQTTSATSKKKGKGVKGEGDFALEALVKGSRAGGKKAK